MTTDLDPIDRGIVRLLKDDGRMPSIEIARRVGVSEKTVRTRISRLIAKQRMRVRAELQGGPTRMAFCIRTEQGKRRAVASRLAERDDVDHVYMTTGAFDLVVLASFSTDGTAFEFLTTHLEEGDGIRHVESCHLIQEASAGESATASADLASFGRAIEQFILRCLKAESLQEVLDLACDALVTDFGADKARVILAEPIGQQQRQSDPKRVIDIRDNGLATHRGLSQRFIDDGWKRVRDMLAGGKYLLYALQTGQHLVVEDAATDPILHDLHDLYESEGIKSLIGLPVIHDAEVIGSLSLYFTRRYSPSSEDVALLQAFADQVGRAAQQIRSRSADDSQPENESATTLFV